MHIQPLTSYFLSHLSTFLLFGIQRTDLKRPVYAFKNTSVHVSVMIVCPPSVHPVISCFLIFFMIAYLFISFLFIVFFCFISLSFLPSSSCWDQHVTHATRRWQPTISLFSLIRFVSGKITKTCGQPSRPEHCDSKHCV